MFVGLKLEVEAAAGIRLRVCEIASKRVILGGGTLTDIRQVASRITSGAIRISQSFHIIA